MVMNMHQHKFKWLQKFQLRRTLTVSSFITLSGALLSGCVGDPAYFYQRQNTGNASCAPLFDVAQIQNLSTKMPILPGQLPTRDMITANDAPTEADSLAIGMLESAIRNCKAQREAAGIPTTASEDILQARISGLRYALFQGEIPFAVYNYGLAQALKQHTAFISQSEQAYAQGNTISDQRMAQTLNQYMRTYTAANRTWTCTSDMNGYSATCR